MTPTEQLAVALAEVLTESSRSTIREVTPLPTDLLRLQEVAARLEMPLVMVKRLVRTRVINTVRLIGANGRPVKREGLRVARTELDRYVASLPEGRPNKKPFRRASSPAA